MNINTKEINMINTNELSTENNNTNTTNEASSINKRITLLLFIFVVEHNVRLFI